MSILRLDAVRREIGDFVILDSVNGSIARGERVGLVGPNGAGKTTLLKIVSGRDDPDRGTAHTAAGIRVGMLGQESNRDEAFAGSPSVLRAVRSGAAEVERLEIQLAELESAGAGAVETREYAKLRERFDHLGGYHIDQRVEETLSGLGVPREDWDRSPIALSGGEQTRVALARLLVDDPDLLLLDEPTNHLDLAALEWLEAYLGRREGALLVASHDRAFLDAVVTRIWELRDRQLTPFKGGYSAYLQQRESADARQRKDADTTTEQIARERELIQRYRSHRKYSKMHEHEKRLETLLAAKTEAPRPQAKLALPTQALLGGGPARSGDVALSLEGMLVGFPRSSAAPQGVPILAVTRLEATRGDRIGVVGPNGAGKTTLLRTVAGVLSPLDGFIKLGANVQPGYLAQIREAPIPGATVMDAILAAARVENGPARSYLARFLFRGEDVFKPVSELSGGERSRLELALLGITPANLLLLDEPTNHLDIPAREALESFLRSTESTMLIVSHDRRLLESVCGSLWVVAPGEGAEPGKVARFDGGYTAWRAAVADGWTVESALARAPIAQRVGGVVAASVVAAPKPAAVVPSSNGKRATTKQPALSKDAYKRQIGRIEEDLTRLGVRRNQLELALGDSKVQTNFVELRRLTSELADVDGGLAQAEEAWLALSERAPR